MIGIPPPAIGKYLKAISPSLMTLSLRGASERVPLEPLLRGIQRRAKVR